MCIACKGLKNLVDLQLNINNNYAIYRPKTKLKMYQFQSSLADLHLSLLFLKSDILNLCVKSQECKWNSKHGDKASWRLGQSNRGWSCCSFLKFSENPKEVSFVGIDL